MKKPKLLFLMVLMCSFMANAQNTDLTISIQLDGYGEEISWTLTDIDETTTYGEVSEGDYADEDGNLVTEVLSVPTGQEYLFTIKDSYGDGLGNSGWYEVEAFGFIYASGEGNFGKIASHSFVLTTPDDLNARMENIIMESFVKQEVVQIKGSYSNHGLNTINSLDINWTVNEGTVHTENVTGLNLSSNESAEFTHDISWDASLANANDLNTLKVWVDNPNGSSDENPDDDTLTKEIYVLVNSSKRMALIEHFTNASCGPCASQNPVLNELLQSGTNPSNVAHVAVHTSWPGTDPMYSFNQTNGQNNARVSFYGVSGVPNAVLGGNQFQGGPANITQAMIDNEIGRPGLFNIDIGFAKKQEKSFSFNINLTSLADFSKLSPEGVNIFISLVEDKEYEAAPGSNGETSFENVMRYMKNVDGENIGSPAYEEEQTINYSVSPDEEILLENCQLVVFLQDTISKDVYMAAQKNFVVPPKATMNVDDGETSVHDQTKPIIQFNQAVRKLNDDPIDDPSPYITFKKDNELGEDVLFTADYDDDLYQIVIDPDTLYPSTNYYFALNDGLENNENDLVTGKSISFTTHTPTVPVAQFNPSNSTNDVGLDQELKISFDQEIRHLDDSPIVNPAEVLELRKESSTGELVTIESSLHGDTTFTVNSSEILELNTVYYLGFKENLENRYDMEYTAESITFTTTSNEPTLTFLPEDGTTDVGLNVKIKFIFDDVMRKLDNTLIASPSDFLTLKKENASGEDIAFTATIDEERKTITMVPESNLEMNSVYFVAVSAGLENVKGVPFSGATASFTTGEETTGIHSSESTPLQLYPNPAVDYIVIGKDFSQMEGAFVRIIDATGKMVYQEEWSAVSNGFIYIQDLKEGVYLLKIGNESSLKSEKFIKTK